MYYVGVIGAAVCSDEVYEKARAVGLGLAREGLVIVCGGRGGVMEAVSRGAWEGKGTVIGILPERSRDSGNRYLTYSIPTGLGDARNAIIACASDVLIAISGGYGTLSEIALARKAGKPVIGLGTWRAVDGCGTDLDIILALTPEEAVAKVLEILG